MTAVATKPGKGAMQRRSLEAVTSVSLGSPPEGVLLVSAAAAGAGAGAGRELELWAAGAAVTQQQQQRQQ